MKAFILLAMIFCHLVDDFVLQGILANLKQRVWWKKNYPNPRYRYDYLIALFAHSFSWTFTMMLPAAAFNEFNCSPVFIGMFVINFIIHAYIDNLKANELKINLWEDQCAHLIQIFITWLLAV